MKQELMSEESVKKMLNISDFRSLKKDQIIQFVSNMPKMSKEVAMKCIEQFPSFTDFANTALDHYYDLCKTNTRIAHAEALNGYKTILNTLEVQLEKDDLTFEDRSGIIDRMMYVGERIELVEDKRAEIIKKAQQYGTVALGLSLCVAGAILGVVVDIKNGVQNHNI